MAKASIGNLIKNQISGVRKQISEHEKALRSLRQKEKNIQQAARLLGGRGAVVRRRRRRVGLKAKVRKRRRTAAKTLTRGGRTNWEATMKSLPPTFTIERLARSKGAKGKSRAYLHQIINRWKKAGAIKSAGRATYQKV